jgi:septum site-determining protein MinD
MVTDTCALVGAVGGAGTTRLTLECAALLAREGRDAAVLDAAYATQGLADRTPGRVDPDVTTLCLGEAPLEDGLVDLDVGGAGRLAVCPARAPFERVARAKTPEAAEAFADRVEEANRAFDHVLVDAPPLASNQAVAAVTAADRVAVVCDADRAAAGVPRTEDRLVDVGVDASLTVVTGTDAHPDADAAVPPLESEWPAPAATAREAVADAVEAAVGVEVARDEDEGLRSRLPV